MSRVVARGAVMVQRPCVALPCCAVQRPCRYAGVVSRDRHVRHLVVRPMSSFSRDKDGLASSSFLKDVRSEEAKVASEALDSEVRGLVEKSIVSRKYHVTVGDVAAEAGIPIGQAQQALTALASDSQAVLKVSDQGDIVYEFGKNFKDIVRSKSLRIRLEPTVDKVKNVLAYLGRVAFGTALVSSVAIVTVALSVLSSSNDSRNDNRRSMQFRSPMYFNMMDFFWYFDPWYYRRSYYYAKRPDEMGFLESVFSCVFGDGDPNDGFEAERWNALGRFIQSRGGVVTAEEVAPFLDATMDGLRKAMDTDGVVVDESFVLPALVKFDGRADVDASGNIVYVFPELQTSARKTPMPVPYDAILEEDWKFTRATNGQKILVGLLGLFNFVGVVALSAALQNPRNIYVLALNGLQGVVGLMPYLQAYALSFAVIPFVRWLSLKKTNAEIQDRNAARMTAAKSLLQPSKSLQQKLASKKSKAVFRTVQDKDVIYRSDKNLDETQYAEAESSDWERRFKQKHSP